MRYTGPKLKILRRLNLQKLPGLTTKNIKNLKESSKKQSLFSIRLIEKQKLRYNFGISDHQFFNYVKRAQKMPGSTGETLLKLLEMRFDNIIYRMGLAPTINSAKQLITHGHFLINKKKVKIPSYQCKINDEISISPKSKNFISQELIQKSREKIKEKRIPNHVLWDENRLVGTISQDISLKDPIIEQYYQELNLQILYVIEFFARRL